MPLSVSLVALVPLSTWWDNPAVASDMELSEFRERDPKDMMPREPLDVRRNGRGLWGCFAFFAPASFSCALEVVGLSWRPSLKANTDSWGKLDVLSSKELSAVAEATLSRSALDLGTAAAVLVASWDDDAVATGLLAPAVVSERELSSQSRDNSPKLITPRDPCEVLRKGRGLACCCRRSFCCWSLSVA